jgi:hypothetical protein
MQSKAWDQSKLEGVARLVPPLFCITNVRSTAPKIVQGVVVEVIFLFSKSILLSSVLLSSGAFSIYIRSI